MTQQKSPIDRKVFRKEFSNSFKYDAASVSDEQVAVKYIEWLEDKLHSMQFSLNNIRQILYGP